MTGRDGLYACVTSIQNKKGGAAVRMDMTEGNMKAHYNNRLRPAGLITVFFLCFAACVPLIGPYSPTAYKNATSLKAETLALTDKANTPYSDNEKKIDALLVEIDKAYEYVHGIPSNELSARQWAVLKKPDGDLLGKFFGRWKSEGTLKPLYISEFRGIISDAFDEIICLEANKKAANQCLK
jgi:hypothetical protein